MEKLESKAGTYGWLCLGAGIVAWDLLAKETLSHAADRALEHPIGKYAALVGGIVVTAHVFNAFDHYDIPDPILKANDFLESVRNRLWQPEKN